MALGLDIGGANIKAATAAGVARSRLFELWRQPERLADALSELNQSLPSTDVVAVTMTGELCDCFPTKRDGVRSILAAVSQLYSNQEIVVWSTAGRFVTVAEALCDHLAVAAANWHAQATFVGRYIPKGSAILIDCGSTTTDIIPLQDGRPVPLASTDVGRLQSGELVYTGARRTPLYPLLNRPVAAEFFATSHDALLLLGFAPEDPLDLETADGRPATKEFAHARIARVIGGDGETVSRSVTFDLANLAFETQCRSIRDAIEKVRGSLKGERVSLIESGSGNVLITGATIFQDKYWASTHLLRKILGQPISDAACAYAVAILASER